MTGQSNSPWGAFLTIAGLATVLVGASLTVELGESFWSLYETYDLVLALILALGIVAVVLNHRTRSPILLGLAVTASGCGLDSSLFWPIEGSEPGPGAWIMSLGALTAAAGSVQLCVD